jgi:hypothetical protein
LAIDPHYPPALIWKEIALFTMKKTLFLAIAIAIAVVMVALSLVARIITKAANADGGNTCGH